jgi:hypothetical protein
LTRYKLLQRNRKLVHLHNTDPKLTGADLGRKFNITRQRACTILRKYKSIRICENCDHFKEFNHCSCRNGNDIVLTPNKCYDWQPVRVNI